MAMRHHWVIPARRRSSRATLVEDPTLGLPQFLKCHPRPSEKMLGIQLGKVLVQEGHHQLIVVACLIYSHIRDCTDYGIAWLILHISVPSSESKAISGTFGLQVSRGLPILLETQSHPSTAP